MSELSIECQPILPDGFTLKTLNLTQLDEICDFLNHNYTENSECGLRAIFCRDYIYWYLKYIPPGFIIGLIHKRKLVGLITAMFTDMIIYGTKLKVPYINFLCVHSKLRNLGLATILIDQMKLSISKMGLMYALYVITIDDVPDNSDSLDSLDDLATESDIESKLLNSFSELKSYAVPINCPKLISVGFLPANHKSTDNLLIKDKINPFHLITELDLESIVEKLNVYMDKFKIRTYFTLDSARHFLIPKKNIIYSFGIKKSDDGTITDFISLYKSSIYSIQTKKIIYTANITYYYYETMTLTEMIAYVMEKLPSYEIDQLSFNTMAHNETINMIKYFTNFQECFFYNLKTPETIDKQVMFGQY